MSNFGKGSDVRRRRSVSVIQRPGLKYPDSASFYSPSVRYPEYRYDHISRESNDVYAAVRDCLAQTNLDRTRFGTAEWNPLGTFIREGANVFVLCNFVQNQLDGEKDADFLSKCIHGSVLRALVDYVLLAVGPTGQVEFGNAPLQNTVFDSVIEETGAGTVLEFYKQAGDAVGCVDLRGFVSLRNRSGSIKEISNRREAIWETIDLGQSSSLAELGEDGVPRFRVHGYDFRETEAFHSHGRHEYLVNQKILAADTIISLPKLKTHEKVGVTLSLKGCVGIIAQKKCLAHHRSGSPRAGGDEFESDRLGLLRCASKFHEFTYRTSGLTAFGSFLRILDTNMWRIVRRLGVVPFGAWWGNDTAWRMALDTARIVSCGRKGGLNSRPCRKHLVLIDGIVGGEGDGPLRPTAVDSGIVLFSEDPVAADTVAVELMGYDPQKVPLVAEATELERYPVSTGRQGYIDLIYNGYSLLSERICEVVDHAYKPPKGWNGHIEAQSAGGSRSPRKSRR